MLTRLLTLNESADRGRSLAAVTPPPGLLLADEGDDEEETGVFSPSPPWRSSSSSPSSPPPPPPSFLSSPSFLAPLLPPPRTPPTYSPFSPLPSSSPPVPFPVSSTPFISPLLTSHSPLLLNHHSSSHFSPSPSSVSPPPPPPSLPPAPPPPCCSCTSLLPRLLSAHRSEVRRILRGALASLGRRLDSLERRSRRTMRKKRRRQREGEDDEGGGAVSPAPSCSPPHPPITSSSDGQDSPPRSSCSSQSEERRRSRGEEEGGRKERKRRRKNHHRGREKNREEEEEDAGRFVGRMAFSFRGGTEEEAPLTLHKFNHRKHRRREGGTSQSEKAVTVVRQNGYRLPPRLHSSSSQHALHLLQSAQSQSESLDISSGQWRFSDLTSLSFNHGAFHIWSLCSSSSSFSPTPMLRLSAVAVETMSESVRGGACGSPLRRLKDWTAPPSLSADHCYVRKPTPSIRSRQPKQRANHNSRSLHLPRRRPLPLPLCSANGLSAPLAIGQSAAGSDFLSTPGERGKRVSQIRIRRASPRETPLTPMGLPKVKRLKKKEFSLEEIYTNKNYKSPTTNRSLETIFEEPREKDGALLLIGQQRRRRLLLFPDFTQPRKRKRPQGAGLPVALVPRKRAAARRHCRGRDDDADLDVMLVERLSALEDFLTRQGLDV